jgi:dTDP-4-amino-4,6-dideoxygalactose transaminase
MKISKKRIPFSPPDITMKEIRAVVKVLKSGWITTGPQTKEFEKKIAEYCGAERAICLNSATAGLELVLRLFNIGPGDEVITTPYTFAATANIILHTGAKPVFADIKPGEFNIDPEQILKKITPRTKAVIPVDFGGWPCDYDEIKRGLGQQKNKYHPRRGTWQSHLGRPLLLADAAHSIGARYKGQRTGSQADFTVFSFHAVKNITTAEGGAVVFKALPGLSANAIYRELNLLSLHGQSKDALAKSRAGAWQYTIDLPGYKFNMTDIAAAIGLTQLHRYEPEILPGRKRLVQAYLRALGNEPRLVLPVYRTGEKESSYHLFPLRVQGFKEPERNALIQEMAARGVACNVHFIPVVMHPLYKRLGYDIKDYPHCFRMYENEISLPVHAKMTVPDVFYICRELKKILQKFPAKRN